MPSIPFSNQLSKTYWILLVNIQKDEIGRLVSMEQTTTGSTETVAHRENQAT